MAHHLHDWTLVPHCTCGLTLNDYLRILRSRILELESYMEVVKHCSEQLVICHRCRDAANAALSDKITT